MPTQAEFNKLTKASKDEIRKILLGNETSKASTNYLYNKNFSSLSEENRNRINELLKPERKRERKTTPPPEPQQEQNELIQYQSPQRQPEQYQSPQRRLQVAISNSTNNPVIKTIGAIAIVKALIPDELMTTIMNFSSGLITQSVQNQLTAQMTETVINTAVKTIEQKIKAELLPLVERYIAEAIGNMQYYASIGAITMVSVYFIGIAVSEMRAYIKERQRLKMMENLIDAKIKPSEEEIKKMNERIKVLEEDARKRAVQDLRAEITRINRTETEQRPEQRTQEIEARIEQQTQETAMTPQKEAPKKKQLTNEEMEYRQRLQTHLNECKKYY